VSDDVLNFGFLAAYQNLSVVGVLNDYCAFGPQTEVVGEDAVEKRSERRSLEHTDAVGQRDRFFDGAQTVSEADTLGVAVEICRKPRGVDAMKA